jgi:cell division protein FtsQ
MLGGFPALALVAAALWAVAAGVPSRMALGLATAASQAGLTVRQVDIEGQVHQPRLAIYRAVLTGGSDSMLLLDLDAMRGRLVALPWVADASVMRRWPDRLVVRIVERQPAALWQYRGTIRLIDRAGTTLPAADLADFGHLPLMVGPAANTEAAALVRLLASRPELADAMEAAIWIGNRRWDLRMKSGETIALPEGPAAAPALARFAAIHRDTPLLGRGFVRFDLRIPDRMIVRVSGEAGATAKPSAGARPAGSLSRGIA